ncbi:phospholipase D-like domain-containing protein [Bradyrhizobium sp. SZCCHNRI1009]|uniref:phospholipase D-like domain-containing protein n=1 Tax=Bradyrhizobium sp. SZCCHNRI1009 TaxID=3057277 RepID=UPI0029163BE1|nr:phospholipase D-like domain-containing protein [Bradyrhizobium sp. SZCCHNRI1009]
MSDFENRKSSNGFTSKLWRGERMTMIGFDVAEPEPDLVGFSIEVKSPGARDFSQLRNRIAFSYPAGAGAAVDGNRNFPSTEAPFQKFRWIHFPYRPKDGVYTYRVAKQHMRNDGTLVAGTSLTLDITQSAVTYDGLVDVGFTRNFASSQAYRDQFGNNAEIIPVESRDGPGFDKLDLTNEAGDSVYEWLGFEAYDLLFGFLKEALADPGLTLDVMAYDLNEPDVIGQLEQFGPRLRAIIDDSNAKDNSHKLPGSAESRSAKRFKQAGAAVLRTHFSNLQHNKVLITRRDGRPEKVLCGSTNFTFRGLYIQANNMLVFHSPDVAGLFGEMFDIAFEDPSVFRKNDFSKKWHAVHTEGKPTVQLCFSPHQATDLSLNPIRAAIDQATSSVFYSVAFLSQLGDGPTKDAFDRVMERPIFSYGTVDKRGALELRKPDGSIGLVDFAYLASKAPEPFRSEWSGGKGRNIHHKFLVTDFSLPTAKVFTGSSNFSPSGEKGNGDHLIMIEDRKIATSYAIEATRVFDHLQFRNRMRDAFKGKSERQRSASAPAAITLRKPTALSGKPAWFERFYVDGSQAERDRLLFSS